MKPCPNIACGNLVPKHYLEHMTCFLCMFFGKPEVRNAPPLKLARTNRGDRRRP
jgi:hypothetical protein